MQGLPYFAPLRFAYCSFHVLGPQVFGQDLREILDLATHPSVYPLSLDQLRGLRSVRSIHEHQRVVLARPGACPALYNSEGTDPCVPPGAVEISLYHSGHHPRGGALIYRIEFRGKSLVFATDTEGYEGGDQRLIRLARETDLLIHDSEYVDREYNGPPIVRQGWGHSTWRMAVEVGREARAKRLALTHHHAYHDDETLRRIEKEAQAILPHAFVAREGTTITI
jgi:phosphoribosyl 1,2-cyclic phosphodiesterase